MELENDLLSLQNGEEIDYRKIIFENKERAEDVINKLNKMRELHKDPITIADLFNLVGISEVEDIFYHFGWNNRPEDDFKVDDFFRVEEIILAGKTYYILRFPDAYFIGGDYNGF